MGFARLRGRADRDRRWTSDGHARRRARGALRRRLPAEARLRHPRVPEPVGADAVAGAPAGAGRAVPPLRRADPRGRRLPRALLRRRVAAVAVVARRPTSCCRPARSRRSSPPASGMGWARRARRARRARWPTPSRTPTSARARSGSGWSRSTAAPATSTPASRAPGRSTPRTGRRCRRRWRRTCPTASTWSEPTGGMFTWVTVPERDRRRASCAPPRPRRASPTSPAARSTWPTTGTTRCASPSPTSAEPDLEEAGPPAGGS